MSDIPQAPECARARLEPELDDHVVQAAQRHARRVEQAERAAHYQQLAIDARFDQALGEGRR